jgi:mRNA interferase RelE/StbE
MAEFRVLFRASVWKEFRPIPKKELERILGRISARGRDPRPDGVEKLTGQDRYRVRQGRYRIVYSVQDEDLTIWVVKVGHRKDVCR